LSGVKNSEVVTSKLEEVEARHKKVLNSCGLGGFIYNPDAEKVLSLTSGELKAISAEQCGEYAFLLANYSLWVQLTYNKSKLIHDWCIDSIDRLLAKEYANYNKPNDYTKYETKRHMFSASNTYAKELADIAREHKSTLDTLSNIAQNIKFMSESLIELQRSKRKYYDNRHN